MIIIAVSTAAFCGVILGLFNSRFRLVPDKRLRLVMEVLPGFNCGSCGHATCALFAEALVSGKAEHHACVPGGPRAASALSEILGVEMSKVEAKLAVIHCKGGKAEASVRSVYDGLSDCHSATMIGNGDRTCQDGCLGLGTCVRACPFGAISITVNGVAAVSPDLCTGCGNCIKSCPRGLIELIPGIHKIFVACGNHDYGAHVKKYCSVGCTACGLCVKASLSGAVEIENNLPRLDYEFGDTFVTAAHKCPSNCFVDLVKARPKVNIDTKCTGCGECLHICPVKGAITGEPGERHVIQKTMCIGCGRCLNICPAHAISLWGGLGYGAPDITRYRKMR